VYFVRWDYDTKQVVRFRRTGQCNRCGECCRKCVSFRVVFGSDQPVEPARDGGETTDATGTWYEVEGTTPRRFFGHFKVTNGETCCALKKDNGRVSCGDYDDRHNLCTDWPLAPELVEAFPNCGYFFEEVTRWDLDELEQTTVENTGRLME
jgi:hypothetical protein